MLLARKGKRVKNPMEDPCHRTNAVPAPEKPTYQQLLDRVLELEETEKMYRSLADNTSDLFYRADLNGNLTYLSHSAYELTGYTQEECLGLNIAENFYLIPEEREQFLAMLHKQGRVENFAASLRRKDGSIWWAMTNSHLFYDADGNIAGVEGVTRDITKRQQAMQAIVREKEKAQLYLDIAGVMFAALNRQGEIILMNKKGHEILGYPEGTLIGHNWFELCLPAAVQPEIKEIFQRQMAGEFNPLEFYENPVLDSSGTERIIAFHNSLLHDDNGISGILFSGEDITERKKAERQLQDSEHKFKTTFMTSPDAICLNRLSDGAYIEINDGFTRILGYTSADISGRSSVDLNIWENLDTRKCLVRRLMEQGHVDNLEAEFVAKDGSVKNGFMSARIIDLAGEQVILSVTRDMTERRKTEEDMTFLTFAIDHIGEAIYLTDETGQMQYVNNEASRELGYSKEELLQMTVWDIDRHFSQQEWFSLWDNFLEQGRIDFESVHMRKDGSVFPVAINANYIQYHGKGYNLGLVSNITERKRNEAQRQQLEEKIVQTQKLESLGILAGGIAHDFNNLLAAIMGHSELTKRRLPPGAAAIENLQQIEKAAERAADLAKQMLAYSGRGKFVLETIDLNFLLQEMLHMLQVSISKKAVLRLRPYASLPAVSVDATQIRQIIMNLVINASEAIGEKSGVISISTGCMDCDESYLRNVWLDENLSDGLYVYLEIADTGCGMSKEILAKIFDPFFSTKFTGRGLGMSAVLGIVRGHKGALKVYSEPGKGTTFKILLPASEKPAQLFNGTVQEEHWEGSGMVLLVDDEESARGVGIEMLKESGFTTLTAVDGREALEIYRAHPEIAFVILDLTMPKMDGEQCFRELKKINPAVKVIISSGYNEFEVTQRFAGKQVAAFVQKPYRLSTLRNAIRNLINS